MPTNLERYGLWASLRSFLVRMSIKLFNFHLCKVVWGSRKNYPEPSGYTMEMVDAARFSVLAEPEQVTTFAQAFHHGHQCAVTCYQGELVGYNFFAEQRTPVNDNVDFLLGDDMLYSYAGFTAPEHRGRGLSPARWTFARQVREALGEHRETVLYIGLDNLASLYSGGKSRNELIGYSAYWTLGQRTFCFRSPGCKAKGVGFVASPRKD